MALDADPATSANAPATIPGIGREYPPVPARAMFGRDGDIAAPDGASRANSAYHIRRRKSKRNATQPLDRFPSERITIDRKSTRLNSSHLVISYAVFCLKKKISTNIYIMDLGISI